MKNVEALRMTMHRKHLGRFTRQLNELEAYHELDKLLRKVRGRERTFGGRERERERGREGLPALERLLTFGSGHDYRLLVLGRA